MSQKMPLRASFRLSDQITSRFSQGRPECILLAFYRALVHVSPGFN